ncbi:IFI6/IFI27 family protein [Abortiporus biennis]
MVPNILKAIIVAVAGFSLSPLLVGGGLGAIGFGAAGPIAGSIAATSQSAIGNVVAGSLFATLQSIAMGGALAGTVNTIQVGERTFENTDSNDITINFTRSHLL